MSAMLPILLILGLVVAWPSHVPARDFKPSNGFCASDCARASVGSVTTAASMRRRKFIFSLLVCSNLSCSDLGMAIGRDERSRTVMLIYITITLHLLSREINDGSPLYCS